MWKQCDERKPGALVKGPGFGEKRSSPILDLLLLRYGWDLIETTRKLEAHVFTHPADNWAVN